MRFLFVLSGILLLTTSGGCGGHTSYVEAEQTALGRVVIYRNGVAYYERRANVAGNKLSLQVPADKVDDFLKSLTVKDARTGESLPIAFPSRNIEGAGTIAMTVQLPTSGPREVALTYVTEAASWKPSYRVMVEDNSKVSLEGWAIVDNTSGEDWQAVRVGVGSSSALSFRYDLHSIRLVQRETLQSQDTFALAPPSGGSMYRENREKEVVVLGDLSDSEIPRQPGHPSIVAQSIPTASFPAPTSASTNRMHRPYRGADKSKKNEIPAVREQAPFAQQGPAATDDSRLRALAQSLKRRKSNIVIEGYADANEPDPEAQAIDRANNLRNQLILNGVPPAQLQVSAKGVVPGQRAGVRLVASNTPATDNQPKKAADHLEEGGNPVGESHFESKLPMTVKRGTSAMVSIVHQDAAGAIVYLYDAESPSGNSRFAFKSVRFRNPTGSTLEHGPVTVFGDGRFIGEGITDPIPPHSLAVVPFALDRQIVIERDGTENDRISRLVKLHRGVLTAEVQHVRLTKLKITNRLQTPTLVLLRHTVGKGWHLLKSPKIAEKFGESRLFEVPIPAGQSVVTQIEEATPMVRTLDLRSPIGIDLIRVYLEAPKVDPTFLAAMTGLLKTYNEMMKHQEIIANLRQRGEEYRVRLDELHSQIMSLQMVKTKGTLMQHMQTKMKEISQRVQENTIAIVNHEEKLMIAKVQFHNGLSELTLQQAKDKKNKENESTL